MFHTSSFLILEQSTHLDFVWIFIPAKQITFNAYQVKKNKNTMFIIEAPTIELILDYRFGSPSILKLPEMMILEIRKNNYMPP